MNKQHIIYLLILAAIIAGVSMEANMADNNNDQVSYKPKWDAKQPTKRKGLTGTGDTNQGVLGTKNTNGTLGSRTPTGERPISSGQLGSRLPTGARPQAPVTGYRGKRTVYNREDNGQEQAPWWQQVMNDVADVLPDFLPLIPTPIPSPFPGVDIPIPIPPLTSYGSNPVTGSMGGTQKYYPQPHNYDDWWRDYGTKGGRQMVARGEIGGRNMGGEIGGRYMYSSPVLPDGFGTSYNWNNPYRRRGGGGGGGGGGGWDNTPAWLLGLNNWNFNE